VTSFLAHVARASRGFPFLPLPLFRVSWISRSNVRVCLVIPACPFVTCCVVDGTGDAYDNLETLLNSVQLFHHMRNHEHDEAKEVAASAPALFFDAGLDSLLRESWGPALRVWRQQNDPSHELLKCIWEATDPRSRPSVLALLQVTLSEEQYAAARCVILAFGADSPHKASFCHFFGAQDSAGVTLYVSDDFDRSVCM
jgi:hypothetical protein